MAIFICKYLDEKNRVQVLELDVDSKGEALAQLRLKGRPISVEEKGLGSTEITLGEPKKVKITDISLFCKQMSVMLEAGIPLNNAVDIMEHQTTSKPLKAALKKMSTQLKEGNQLSQTMKAQGKVFPNLLVRMIEAGEKTGKIDEVLEKMSVHYTKEVKINRQITGAMIYPAILSLLVIGAVFVLLYVVVPSFKDIFESGGVELPLPTRIVLFLSNWVQSYWYILLLTIIGGTFGFLSYRKTEAGRFQLDLLKLNLPIIKTSIQKIITARFSSTLATLTSAGIPLVDALEAAASTTNNSVVVDKIDKASEGIQKGENLTEMIGQTELFPPMMLSMVKIGEESGSLESMLHKTSAYYEEELEAAIKQLLSLMEPALIIIMGIVIGGIVASIMLPLLGLAGAVESGAGQ
ncbi:type IV pilus assembly protein PilC [Streptococcus gallinaceus]|uniref:type II secretion system F family protein n=1 Tax=Streptococcus gallinaceus TaxID=165758 RepID=UPI00209F52E0|nr:type II secretion system F family protein [Streptococcus gallinaceus]MCP1638533.1 type IV pilus assembly protein PilC [Streptococcus gallinaceus]MCP1769380.1 type IV pilus assembly protein PilC [Streptococcus gallinaceus]